MFLSGMLWTRYYKNGNEANYVDLFRKCELCYFIVKKLECNTDAFKKHNNPPVFVRLRTKVLCRLSNGEHWKNISSLIKCEGFEQRLKLNRVKMIYHFRCSTASNTQRNLSKK